MILFLKADHFALFQEDPRTVWKREVLNPEGHSPGLGQTEQKGEFGEHDDNSHKAASLA